MRQGARVGENRAEQTPPASADLCMHTHMWVRDHVWVPALIQTVLWDRRRGQA